MRASRPGVTAIVFAIITLLIAEIAASAASVPAPVSLASVANPADLVFLYPVSRALQIVYSFKSAASEPTSLDLSCSLMDRSGKILDTQTNSIEAVPGVVSNVTFSTDVRHFPYGQYAVRLIARHGADELLRNTTLVGVISDADLPKARPGEFLFGLDTSLSPCYLDERLLRFTQLMGTDIIRGGTATWADRLNTWDDQIRKAAPIYQKYQLKLCYNLQPPDQRVKDRAAYMEVATAHGEMVARNYKSLAPFFELGNEPDIGFFHGPIQLYAQGFIKLREAIKRGNPDAIVMNGGWAYDQTRINDFYNFLKPDQIDMIAYHGHGDISSEEHAYQLNKSIATKHGFGDKQLADTETGIMAVSSAQEEIQARVCVEKGVFAQSIHAPFYMWFRLSFEHPDSYGCTIDRTQPRLSIMAYRAMVQRLRGYRFEQTLSLPYTDTQAYLFEQIGGPGRACVMWVDGRERRQAFLRMTGARGVTTSDIYGNQHAFGLLAGDIAAVPLSDDPIWLCWSNAGNAEVSIEPSLLDAPSAACFQENSTTPMQVTVRNPLDHDVSATLDVQAASDTPLSIAPASSIFDLAPHAARAIDLTATVGEVHNAVTWPTQWTVFPRTRKDVDPATLKDVPEALPGDHGSVKGTTAILQDGKIDLKTLSKYQRGEEKVPAMVTGIVQCADDRTVTMGAGADFWMQWTLDGRPVFDDLTNGNGPGYTPLDHLFDLHLKKGLNLLVCKVLSGSQGFTLAIGSPDEIEGASGTSTRNTAQLTYRFDKSSIVSDVVRIAYLRPVEPLGNLKIDSPLDAWERFVPNIVLGDRNVVNLHFKDPDASLWWKGYSDLSAVAWLRGDASNLYLVIQVTDDINQPAPDASELSQFDSVALAFCPSDSDQITQYRIGQVGDHVAVVKTNGRGAAAGQVAQSELSADVQRSDGTTTYRIALSRKITGDSFNLNFLINDNDAGTLKQYLEWQPGMAMLRGPKNWYRVRFAGAP
jgi:hypothetical protein